MELNWVIAFLSVCVTLILGLMLHARERSLVKRLKEFTGVLEKLETLDTDSADWIRKTVRALSIKAHAKETKGRMIASLFLVSTALLTLSLLIMVFTILSNEVFGPNPAQAFMFVTGCIFGLPGTIGYVVAMVATLIDLFRGIREEKMGESI